MGRIIRSDGYSADPDNVNGILEMKPPKTRRELQQCLGRYNWLRAFLSANIGEEVAENCFSSLIKELTVLNKKNVKFSWNQVAQNAFDNMKSRLSSEKVITFADFSQPFCLVTDASKIACAGILLQNINNQQKIIAVVSKTLMVTEQNWSATEREAYAILFSIEN